MAKYIHLSLPDRIAQVIESKARMQYISKADVARQFLMNALIDESVAEMRKKGYAISKIAQALDVPTVSVMESLRKTGADEEIYPE